VLATIEHASRAATNDLRRMLAMLRTGDGEVWSGQGAAERGLRASMLRATGWTATAGGPAAAPRGPSLRWPVDVALGLSLVAVNITGSLVPEPGSTARYAEHMLPALVVLAALPGIALTFRRYVPAVAFVVAVATLIAFLVSGWQEGTLPWSVLVAGYALGVWAPAVRGVAVLASVYAALGILLIIDLPHLRDGSPAGSLVFLLPWGIGLAVRWRRRSDEMAVMEALAAEQRHAARAERAIAEQRLEIARELHDLVTHGVAAIAVQAGSARYQLGPGSAREVLGRIEGITRAALEDLRRMLRLLDDRHGVDFAPVPGLEDLGALVELHRAAHGPVRLDVDATVEQEPASVRLTVYRLIQEALTNVARHAPGAATTVLVRSTPTEIEINVENDGGRHRPSKPAPGGPHRLPEVPAGGPYRPPEAAPGGHGLAGMRERVAIAGGSVSSRPMADGGFLVRAELPRDVVS
jgi:signal transduction histidine kinase